MYHPDQQYQAHKLHLEDLYEQVEHGRMLATLTHHQHARVRAASRQLGLLLVTFGSWLAHSAQRDEQPTATVDCRLQIANSAECTTPCC
jgi:hypothetical protein